MTLYYQGVFLRPPHMDKHWSLCIRHDDEEVCERFKSLCFQTLPDSLHWFCQSDGCDFKMFEFWVRPTTENQDLMLEEGMRIAAEMGLSFEIGEL